MIEAASAFLTFLATTGPYGALLAAILVGLALVLIIYAASSGILNDRRTGKQQTEFQGRLLEAQDRLIKALDEMGETEAVLRRENAELRESVGRLTVDIALLRNQQRRTIDLLRAVMEGRLQPSAIELPADGTVPA